MREAIKFAGPCAQCVSDPRHYTLFQLPFPNYPFTHYTNLTLFHFPFPFPILPFCIPVYCILKYPVYQYTVYKCPVYQYTVYLSTLYTVLCIMYTSIPRAWGGSLGGGPGPMSAAQNVPSPLGFGVVFYDDFDIDF